MSYRFKNENFSGYRIHYGISSIPEKNLFETSSGMEGFFEEGNGGTYIHDSLRNRFFLEWLLGEAGIEGDLEGSEGSVLNEILRREVDFL